MSDEKQRKRGWSLADDAWVAWLERHVASPKEAWAEGGFMEARQEFVERMEDAEQRGYARGIREAWAAVEALTQSISVAYRTGPDRLAGLPGDQEMFP